MPKCWSAKGKGLKVPDAHPYPRLYRSAPPPPPRLLGLGISIVNFLIADVIQFVFGTMTIFSQGDGTKIKFDMIQGGDIYKFSTVDLYHLESYFASTVHFVQPHSANDDGRRVQLTVSRSGSIRRAITHTNKQKNLLLFSVIDLVKLQKIGI